MLDVARQYCAKQARLMLPDARMVPAAAHRSLQRAETYPTACSRAAADRCRYKRWRKNCCTGNPLTERLGRAGSPGANVKRGCQGVQGTGMR